MASQTKQRLRLTIRGAVQGVGFRPFIYRLATDLGLTGWVCNTAGGVLIEVEGAATTLQDFLLKVGRDCPERAAIQSLEPTFLDATGYTTFEIRDSQSGDAEAWISPDIATCADCRQELLNPLDRRYRYPFINCTHCGPRYTIITGLPYDRANTSMQKFRMCQDCHAEYHNPDDRRFHAQPNACPDCGPHLALWDRFGNVLSEHEEALERSIAWVQEGMILALKGLGGFHLMVDASNDVAVRRLRQRKQRHGKPLAVMFPDLLSIKAACAVSPMEERLLTSPEAPIVLLRRNVAGGVAISPEVAPGNPYLGVMLPYSPVHILFLHDLGRPVVATSGNLSEETICFDEKEALKRLDSIADFFLVHNRPILRAVDDSVVRVILDTEQVVRRARGYAPLPVMIEHSLPPTLAVGGHLKNCVALSKDKSVFISQHIGDLETAQSYEAFHNVINDLKNLYKIKPERVVCDLHPGYHSTEAAYTMLLPVTAVQHHEAHVLACIAENEIPLPVLGVSWDGSGFGTDGTVWGGEFISVSAEGSRRFACFDTFPLPGGEVAVREPRRALLGALHESLSKKDFEEVLKKNILRFSPEEQEAILQMILKKFNSPMTSSVGRRFDAVSALVGLCDVSTFEGQAAMALEFALPDHPTEESYPFQIIKSEETVPLLIHAPPWDEVLRDVKNQVPKEIIAARFHHMLSDIIVACARASGLQRVALTGGCFQNRYLTERAVIKLRAAGFQAYWHQRVPPNDGGLALGQLAALGREGKGL